MKHLALPQWDSACGAALGQPGAVAARGEAPLSELDSRTSIPVQVAFRNLSTQIKIVIKLSEKHFTLFPRRDKKGLC